MGDDRSTSQIFHNERFVKSWLDERELPSVEAARPAQCPKCNSAARIPGRGLCIQGHGKRRRQQRGPVAPDRAPEIVELFVRRYHCECGATITALPFGIAPRKHFSSAAIALSFALFGLLVLAPEEVRRRVSPWPIVGPSARRWRSLFRWIEEARDGALFEAARASPPGFSARQIATRVAAALAAVATTATTVPTPDLTFWRAARMA